MALTSSSCLNKETAVPLPPHLPGAAVVATVNMESDYRYQVFYNLTTNSVVSSNEFTAWDLGFETSADGWHVVMNTARFMKVYPVAKADFSAVNATDTVGVPAAIDAPSGNLDSTAFNDWKTGKVYVIGRGYNATGQDQGMAKVKILGVTDTSYQVQWALLDGSGREQTIVVLKDDRYNLSFLSFDNGGKTPVIEPPKKDWDVVFTKYTHIYKELDNMPYSVVGCVLNRYQTTGASDTTQKVFDNVVIEDALAAGWSKDINIIGFEWKTYTGTTYTVDTTRKYFVRNAAGAYFKMRFIGFLNKSGAKGNPAWQCQQL